MVFRRLKLREMRNGRMRDANRKLQFSLIYIRVDDQMTNAEIRILCPYNYQPVKASYYYDKETKDVNRLLHARDFSLKDQPTE